MKKHNTIRIFAALGTATALTLAAPMAALAHVSVSPDSAQAAGYSVLTFSVGHGCEGSPTTALTFTIPESIVSVTPTVNPGWTITSDATTVTYTAETPLPDHHRTTFELSVKVPDAPGTTLEFPVLQECEVGSTDWSDTADEGGAEGDFPAPVVAVTTASDTAHGSGHDGQGDNDSAAGEDAAEDGAAAGSGGSASEDVLARVLGIGGLVVGVVGLIIGVSGRRMAAEKGNK